MKDKPILIVDDEPDLLAMVRSIFERAGFTQIITASSGEAALDECSKKEPAMAILDVMMPDMDGFELLREIRQTSEIPVLMLTAKGEAEDRCRGLELGAEDYPVSTRTVILAASTVDLDRAEVRRDEGIFPLTGKEYAIFLKLAENAGRVVTIGALCQAACGEIWMGYENTLMSHIRHLREKIEDTPSAPVSLLTAKGLGYKLMVKGEPH